MGRGPGDGVGPRKSGKVERGGVAEYNTFSCRYRNLGATLADCNVIYF